MVRTAARVRVDEIYQAYGLMHSVNTTTNAYDLNGAIRR